MLTEATILIHQDQLLSALSQAQTGAELTLVLSSNSWDVSHVLLRTGGFVELQIRLKNQDE